MRRSGFNASRRNRNIGTSAAGHGQDNRLVIPQPRHTHPCWWEALKSTVRVNRDVEGISLTFVIEQIDGPLVYATTIDDVCRMLSLLPKGEWEGISTLVFRAPTKKQALLKPTWGRIDYCAELHESGKPPVPPGPTIFLEAVEAGRTLKWSKSLSPEDQHELDRLIEDGHIVRHTSKQIAIESSVSAIRNTQLYRTLPHEIGHWVDYVKRVEHPVDEGGDYSVLVDRYWSRPSAEREAFAHRYADSMRRKLKAARKVPFERILNAEALKEEGIPVEYFAVQA